VKRKDVLINAEGQDHFPIRLPRNRMALLVLPKDLDDADVERITAWVKFIGESSEDHIRLPGPPEPDGTMP
jgi:hypothetical protein